MNSRRRYASVTGALLATTAALATLPAAQGGGGPRCDGRIATIVRGGADNNVNGTNGNDVIVVGGGDDRVDGRKGNDRICGGGGTDLLEGFKGRDYINGQNGEDSAGGGDGNDTIVGGSGDDGFEIIFRGEPKRGSLHGADGEDLVKGSGDGDLLLGGDGPDALNGGPDADHCDGDDPDGSGDGATDTASNCEVVSDIP